jgi:hypothetical protein
MFVYQSEVWCDDCGKQLCDALRDAGKAPENELDETSFDSDDFPKEASDDDNSDSPTHCASNEDCLNHERLSDGRRVGAILGGLTDDGVKYVIERAAIDDGSAKSIHGGLQVEGVSPCVQLWIETFDIELPALPSGNFSSIGGYTIAYYTNDGECYCAKCAAQERGKGQAIMFGTYDEGPDMECAECGRVMESSYGDLEVEESEAT